jgi:hypothetical protein
MTTDRQPSDTPTRPLRQAPPLRPSPMEPDPAYDRERIVLVNDTSWAAQDVAYLQRDRQVEENIRMLLGRQWEVFSPHTGRFVDVTQFMSDQERAWRQRPVVNKLFFWYMLTHARLTENDPVIGFRPSSADRLDAMLAEVMDPIFKTLWQEIGMGEIVDRLVQWMIPGGRAYLKTRLDLELGELVEFQDPQSGELLVQREGGLAVDVLSPLECRGTWDSQPWHKKRWHCHTSFLTAQHIKDTYGVEVHPDPVPQSGLATSHILTRLLFGNGYWGAGSGRTTADVMSAAMDVDTEGLVCVRERWEKPCAQYPQGRLTIVTANAVLYDGARPFQYKYTSPIRSFDYVSVPGRNQGTSPQEFMNPLQRTWNRGWQQLFEHRALSTNPMIELDLASGITEADFVSRPGAIVPVNKRPGVDAFRFVAPPPISGDVWKLQSVVSDQLDIMGNMQGASGSAPTSDASGDLVEALRFNSDRYTTPTAKRVVRELGRWAEDVMAMLPVMWTQEKTISYAGEDNVARVVTVGPEMWNGMVNVTPDLESMIPESQGERRQRIEKMYLMGVFGVPGSPEARRTFLDYSRFPHLSRMVRPGGVDRITAEHTLGLILQGMPAVQVPIYPWFLAAEHVAVFREFMASPDYMKLDDMIQKELELRYQLLGELMMAQVPPSPDGAEQDADGASDGDADNASTPTSNGPAAAA